MYIAYSALTVAYMPIYIAVWLERFKNITCNGLWELYDAARAGCTGGWDHTPKTFTSSKAPVLLKIILGKSNTTDTVSTKLSSL